MKKGLLSIKIKNSMGRKSFFLYGYDRETFNDCIDMIRSTNRKNAIIMNAWFFVINLLYVVCSVFNMFGVTVEQTPFYAAYTLISLIYVIILLAFQKETKRFSIIFFYLVMLELFSYSIIVSVSRPYMPAIMYLILYLLVNLLFMGNCGKAIAIAILGTSILLYTSFKYKTFSIAYQDMYNAIMVDVLAAGLHYMFQRARLAQFVLYQKDLQIQKELDIKSSFDSLTDLLNRGRFFSIAEKVLLIKPKEEYIAVCLVDLDSFKQINDKLGHQMGDKVIQTTGKIISETIDSKGIYKANRITSSWDLTMPYSISGRLGGDEFIILVRGKEKREDILPMLQSMLERLNAVRFDSINGIQASIGVTEIEDGESDMDGAYSRADSALYESKRLGKNRISFYEPSEKPKEKSSKESD